MDTYEEECGFVGKVLASLRFLSQQIYYNNTHVCEYITLCRAQAELHIKLQSDVSFIDNYLNRYKCVV